MKYSITIVLLFALSNLSSTNVFVQQYSTTAGFDTDYNSSYYPIGEIGNHIYFPTTIETHVAPKNGKLTEVLISSKNPIPIFGVRSASKIS